jgi:hypothetical protein
MESILFWANRFLTVFSFLSFSSSSFATFLTASISLFSSFGSGFVRMSKITNSSSLRFSLMWRVSSSFKSRESFTNSKKNFSVSMSPEL